MALARLKREQTAEQAPFLGVRRSAKGLAWRERLDGASRNTALAICQQHGLPELLGRILAARGVGIMDVPLALAPTIKALMPDPSTITDMETAAARLADAIASGEAIAVLGDYDVDGACSSALMLRFLRQHGREARLYIPDRITEGYGPNPTAIRMLAGGGARFIVTVDCGTTSLEALKPAKELGTDVIVVDHHQADERLPDVHAIVNPNRQDDLSGLGHLCAAGVTFMLLVATARELRQRGFYSGSTLAPNLIELLDLVALATVADVVELKGLNRAFVTRGLEVMRLRQNIGLRALIDAAGFSQAPGPYHLGFVLGPRINAGGRIGDAALGAKLLATENEMEAARIAVVLDKLNRERKALEARMLEEAVAQADRMVEANPELPMLLLASQDWHKGVVGLVASRLVERFGRPACVIAWDGARDGTGSLRSVAGVDIGAAVRLAVEEGLLVKGGGHAMAAGLTVTRDKLEALRTRLCGLVREPADAARALSGLDIDGALTPAAVTADLVTLIEQAGPFGQGNPQPRFAFPAHRVKFAKVMGEAHIRCTLEASDGTRLNGIAFRALGQPLGELLLSAGGMPIHVSGTLRRDAWGGRERIELSIDDAADPRQQD